MEKKKKKFTVPHVYVLLMAIIVFFAILSYIIPAGQYDYMTLESGRSVVDASTFHYIDKTPVTLMQLLSSIPRGLVEVAQIVFFIFVIGGSFAVIQETKAIEAGMGRLIKSLKGSSILIIPISMIVLSLGGSVIGLCEETIPFIPIFVSLMVAAGFDSMTGAAIVLCGTGAGFAGAFMNPFTLQVAQTIAGLPLLSAMGFRVAMYCVMIVVTTIFVTLYAKKIKANPEKSLMHEYDKTRDDVVDLEDLPEFSGRKKAVLISFLIGMIILVFGVVKLGWYLDQIAGIFLGLGIVAAAIDHMGFNKYAEVLGQGMSAVATGALVVGVARGILVVMTDGNILHTILYATSSVLMKLPSMFTAVGMYVFQCLLNFIVPSGSGQASVSMPIMAPLADLVGVTRQTACIAFQFGDGISNILTPTSGYFMAGLALAKIPWSKWAKWILPLIGIQYLIGLVFVVIAQMIGLGPF